MPLASMNFRKAFGERQNSTIWSKFGRFFFISSSAWGLIISTGWMWMWQSVIIDSRLCGVPDSQSKDIRRNSSPLLEPVLVHLV